MDLLALLRRPILLVLAVGLLAGCSKEEPPELRRQTQALTPEETRTINFEQLSDWQLWSGQGSLFSSSQSSQGQFSLGLSGIGYAAVRNVIPLTQDDQQTPEVVGYDIWLPPQSPNPSWTGDTQLAIDAPSAGVHQQYLGYRSFAGLARGTWVRVEFPVANWIRQALNNTSYDDLRLIIAINAPSGSAPHYLDRFTLGPVPTTCTPEDDENPCTADECEPSTGVTTHEPLAPGALCGDGDICNGIEACDGAGVCEAGEPLEVDDGNACTADSCDALTGVAHTPVSAGTSCGDGNACNGAELCDGAGACEAGEPLVVDDGNPCTADACDPQGGVSHTPVSAGVACGDGNACNGEEVCDGAGLCASGEPLAVDDGNPCTADACDPQGGVSHTPVSAGVACGDADACNGEEVCDGSGSCQAGAPLVVDDGNPCTVDSCDAGEGVTHTPAAAGTSCEDSDACNGAEACDGNGSCAAGQPINTDDGNACTIGDCDPATGVVTQTPAPVDAPCGDGNACNGSEYCDEAGTCLAGVTPEVDDANPCTADSCDPLFGVDHSPTPAGSSCVDANLCNGEELCDGAGSCTAGLPLEVDDGNLCTSDSCDALAGVMHEAVDDGSSCDDGNACTVSDSCQAGSCAAGEPIVCGAASSCHDPGACDPATGACSDPPKPDGSACNDGVACTAGDSCEAGVCVGGETPSMEEAPCQIAQCDGESGGVVYTQAPEGTACAPDACSTGSCSAAGECIVTSTSVVDDGDPCTIDFCDPILGPTHSECDEVDPTVATTVLASTRWLFTGLFPVQTGVDPADIEERRAALIRGSVTTRTGEAIPSVQVSVHGHPEFGQTLTQADGSFDMVVNGGGSLQLQFHKPGYLDSARRVDARWNQTHQADPVILIPPDPAVTEITLDAASTDFQVARGSVMADDDGERQGTLLFPPGVLATMRHADGTEQLISDLHVRITEFTVGEEGPDAMPANLPSNTGYTYAFEVNADEAVAAGAPEITFSEPLPYYVENFLGFPVGEVVPIGSYSRERGLWIPHDSGVVVEVLDLLDGHVELDLTGDGVAATEAELEAAGISGAELTALASEHPPGTTLWRVELPHFTEPYDCNWPFGPPDDAEPPPGGGPIPGSPDVPEGCEVSQASTLECQTQVFRESVGIAGSSLSLNYSSARVPGRSANRSLTIPLAAESVPPSLKRIDLAVTVAGRHFEQSFPPSADTSTEFTWDGMDRFGNEVQGRQSAQVKLSYVYDGVYGKASRFNNPSQGTLTGSRTREEIYSSKEWTRAIGTWRTSDTGLGGWTLSNHHSYDPGSRRLMLGDGGVLEAAATDNVVENVLGEFSGEFVEGGLARQTSSVFVNSVATASDGSVYLASARNRIFRVTREGRIHRIAGNGTRGTSGDGGLATEAEIDGGNPSLAIGGDGSVYVGDGMNHRVRRIRPDGTIVNFAGTTSRGFSGDGGPATEAEIYVDHIALGPDGSLYISGNRYASGGGVVRRVDPSGTISTIVGDGSGNHVEGELAVEQRIESAESVAVGADGTVYILDDRGHLSRGKCVYSIASDGILRRVAGCPSSGSCTSLKNRAAVSSHLLNWAGGKLAIDPNGLLYVSGNGAGEDGLVFIDGGGVLRSALGDAASYLPYGSGQPVSRTLLPTKYPTVSFDEHGGVITHSGRYVSRLIPGLPGLGPWELFVPAPDREESFVFDRQGRHLRTLHSQTGAELLSFAYDGTGQLASITDAHGLVTTIERAGDGAPTAIVAPYGQRTDLSLNGEGLLDGITRPGGQSYSIAYREGALLTEFQDPTGGVSQVDYDAQGRVTSDEDRLGAPMSLARTEFDGGWSVKRTTALGQEFDYVIERPADGEELRTNYFPNGTSSVANRTKEGSVTTLSDGTSVEVDLQPEARFSMMSPALTTTTLPSGLSRSVEHSQTLVLDGSGPSAELVSQTDDTEVSGHAYRTRFTKSDLQTRTTSPEGRITQEFIDEFGRMIRLQSPGAPTVRTQYTADKVSAIVIDPDGIEGNGDERTTEMSYDSSGRLSTVVDPLTQVTAFTNYDAADRPGSILLPDTSEVRMTYDIEGNVASVTPPGKSAHEMTYGIWGRIERYTPPVGNEVSYQYDLDRHVDLIDFGSDALGQPHQVDFVWDNPTGQLSSITSPSGTIDVGYTLGKMTSLISPSLSGPITTNIAYDGPLPTSVGWSGPIAGQVNWTYNDRFLIETETIGALPETTVTYQYDDDGLVTNAGDLVIERDPASGRVVSKTIGNIRESFEYNEFAELSRQTVELMNGSSVVETLYDVIYDDDGVNGDRDALGRITKKTEWIVEGDTPGTEPRSLASKTYDYGYNQDGRPWLESVAVDGSVVSSYGYDANGNRTSAELNWSQLGYDASFDVSLSEADTEYNDADQLLTYGDTTYEWNNFGQLASKTDTPTGETTFFEYDLYGNLLSVALPDGRSIEYDVDGAGRRVGRRVLDASGVETAFRGWIYRDLLRPIAEVDALGNVVARYVYSDGDGARQNGVSQLATRLGANQDTSLPFAGSNVPEAIEELNASGAVVRTLNLVTNQVGTVELVTDADTGEVVQRIEYDSFGRVLSDSAPGVQPFGFAGGLYDVETGLVRFGARDYDAEVGRWMANDPFGFGGGAENLYAYARTDPINEMDSSGLFVSCVGALMDGMKDSTRCVNDAIDQSRKPFNQCLEEGKFGTNQEIMRCRVQSKNVQRALRECSDAYMCWLAELLMKVPCEMMDVYNDRKRP